MGLTPGSPPARTPAPRSVWLLTSALGGLAAVASVAAQRVASPISTPAWPVLLGFLLALLLAGSLNLEYHYRGQTDAFDHFEVALVPALFFLPPVLVVLLAVAAKTISQLQRRVVPTKATFNVAQWAAAAASGGLVYAWLHRWSGMSHLLFLAIAMLAVMVVNAMAVLFVLAQTQRPLPRRRVPERTASLLRHTAGTGLVNLTFGLLFVAALRSSPWTAPLLLVPLGLLHWASRGYAIGRIEQARLRTMRAATSALAGNAQSEAAVADFLAAIGSGLDRDAVDLIIPTAGVLRVHAWRRGAHEVAVESVSAQQPGGLTQALMTIDRPVRVESAGDTALGRLLRASGLRDCAAAPLWIGPEAAGVLALYGARAPVTLPGRELEIVAELAREAGVALERVALLRAVLEEQAKMSQIVNESRDGIVTFAADGSVTTWNRALEMLTGFRATELVGTAGLPALCPLDASGTSVDFSAWASATDDPPEQVLVQARTGTSRWLSCSYARSNNEIGEPDRLIVLIRDVSELKRTEAMLAAHAAVLELIASGGPLGRSLQVLVEELASTGDGVASAILLDGGGDSGRLQIGAAAGIGREALNDLDALQVQSIGGWPGRALRTGRGLFISDIETDPLSTQLLPLARDLGVRSVSAMPIRAPNHDRIIGVLMLLAGQPGAAAHNGDRDMLGRAAHLAAIAVARAEFEAQLAHQATHDALTGLPNRVSFLDRCEHALRARREDPAVAVFFVDLDRFKIVNDEMGHDAGDQLLREVAERMRRIVRPEDTVARFGGDEFIILCEGCGQLSTLTDLAERMHGVFTRPFVLAGGEVFMTASVGIAVGSEETEAGELVNKADIAMYQAKQRGGNCYEMFDLTMRRPALLSMVTHNALHRALAGGELVMLYQPMVSLSSGKLIGVEALLRWRHPERGLLTPDAFLPFAESSGLIVPIGEHVVAVACDQARQWESAGPDGGPLRMNINLSARELGEAGLVDTISGALNASGVTPASICFEITESALLHDVEATAVTLRRLKDLGVDLAIDDFGTGYASFTYLRRFPVDSLKVDRSFVSGVGNDANDRAIVVAVMSLARSLGLDAVAEGVETAGQLQSLQELGCEVAQGFYLARPTAAENIFADT